MRRRNRAPTQRPLERSRFGHSAAILACLALAQGILSPVSAAPVATDGTATSLSPLSAPTSDLTLRVEDLDTTAAIPTYEWVIYEDDTGDPANSSANRGACYPSGVLPASDPGYPGDPDYPANCPWPSVHTSTGGAGGAPNLVTRGNQDDLNEATGIILPDGDYMISVIATGVITSLAVDALAGETSFTLNSLDHFALGQSVTIGSGDAQDAGSITAIAGSVITIDTPTANPHDAGQAFMAPQEYKIDGTWFSIPIDDASLPVVVGLHPDPLPLTTLKIQVFEDSSPNGQFDANREPGLAGFVGHIEDVLGEVTTDWFGNPLCAEYDVDGNYIAGTGGACVSGADGVITIPNLGSNRYGATVVPPNGQTWIQTTTLEGGLDFDIWAWEGWSGYDPELIVSSGPVAAAWFGFVQPTPFGACPAGPACGRVQGRVISTKSYLPPAGGDTNEGPVSRPWVALAELGLGDDQLVYAARWGTDGTFDIANVPPGEYSVTMWDQQLNLLLSLTKIVVEPGETVNIGDFALPHWFSDVHGTVFYDTNSNGRQDTGELGVAGFPLVLKMRENSLVEQFSRATVTDSQGRYSFPQTYPYGWWTVLEAYSDVFYTTGVTYQADNQPTETTRLGAGVDVSVFNMDGLNSRVDWGVRQYAPGENGGIVGSVTYAVTRNELDPRLAATEDYEPGIPGMLVELWQPVACADNPDPVTFDCDPSGDYVLDTDGGYMRGHLLNTYVTEEFVRPTDCQARHADGTPIQLPFMSPPTGGHECIESPLMGSQVKTGPSEDTTPGGTESEFTLVNGNYGFGDGCFAGTVDATNPGAPICVGADFEALSPADYLVRVISPTDGVFSRPKYQVLREEDINVFDGDQFTPAVPPPACAGAKHEVDVAGIAPDGTLTTTGDGPNAVSNPGFAEGGGSPFEGQLRPLCDVRLVPVQNQKSVAPSFYFFHPVPPPGRLFGALVEDLQLGVNPFEFYYGEKAGIPNAPIGIYDYSGRLVRTLESDPNGFFEVLLPSTRSFNCPLPAGPCPGVYRLIGNDPGSPAQPNLNYDPQYRTLESDWQMWPGLTLLADSALMPTTPVIEFPGSQRTHPPECLPDVGRPQLFAVSQPYGALGDSFTIAGQGFGSSAGSVTLDGAPLTVDGWSDTNISATIPVGMAAGAHQLVITNATTDMATVNGLTFHVIGVGYLPTIITVGPGRDFARIQDALELAASNGPGNDLVVVFPNAPGAFTPLGDYYESLIVHSPVKLQGVGPGGVRTDGSHVTGSIVNGLGFANTNFDDWQTLVDSIHSNPATNWSGNQEIFEGQVIYVLARDDQFAAGTPFDPAIDGLRVINGDEFGYPSTEPFYNVQGGGIFVNAYARELQITNNLLLSNGGSYGGAIRVGTPYIGDNHNDDLRIASNRVIANGGTNLAGAIGLFAGANGYEVAHNDVCGNFSAEYGGGISHFGLSQGTTAHTENAIHDNRIWLNGSYDEGAGVMIAGEVPEDVNTLSPGSGPVDFYNNLVEGNLAADDGGGIRLLMAGNWEINASNNMIVDNVSAHEGGGLALDDATNVRFFNNTVMKNITTATSADSTGDPMPAGLSDTESSALLQSTLPPGHAPYSDPLMFNNIFWDNRAGGFDVSVPAITGIGGAGDPTPIRHWDMGVVGPGALHPTTTVLQETTNSVIVADPSNVVGVDPGVVDPLDVAIGFQPWRGDPHFQQTWIVVADLPLDQMGDYHLPDPSGGPAVDAGAGSKSGVSAPAFDIDGDARPSGGFEIGADEVTTGVPTDTTGPAVSTLGVAPNPTDGASSITLTGSANDTATGGSDIAGAEWYEGAGPHTAMAATDGSFNSPTEALTASIDVSGWSVGDHVLSVRAIDSSSNWGSASNVTLVVSAASGCTTIFDDDFEGGTTSLWSSATNPSRLAVTAAAALEGTRGLAATLSGSSAAYLQDNSPANETSYDASFRFDPNSSVLGSAAETLLLGRSDSGQQLFRIRVRRVGSAYEVRTLLLAGGSQLSSAWRPISDGPHVLAISWTAAASGSLTLSIDGVLQHTQSGNTGAYQLGNVRLGIVTGPSSSASGVQYFDDFQSSR
jgi:SdrD B-like protein/IPT/TIG domain-containing protein